MNKIIAAALAALTLAGCGPAKVQQAPVPTSTMYSTDCRTGPTDCGYADNGTNSDH